MIPHWYEQQTQRMLVNSIETTRRGNTITGWNIKTYCAPGEDLANAALQQAIDQELQRRFFEAPELVDALQKSIEAIAQRTKEGP